MKTPSPLRPDQLPLIPALGALIWFWLALTPSLLPRPALLQGVLCAVAALIGYALGSVVGWALSSTGWKPAEEKRRRARFGLLAFTVVGTVLMLVFNVLWQRRLRINVGSDQLGFGYFPVLFLVGILVFALILMLSRSLRSAGRNLGRRVAKVMPARIAGVLAAVLVAILAYGSFNRFLVDNIVERLDATFMAINGEFSTDLPAPTSEFLSAGPASEQSWKNLGRQGRIFINSAPTAAEISEFTGKPALQPVRAYVGVGTDGDLDLREEAAMAVAELEKTGGFDRAVLNVATGTGRGWVNENQAQALEFMWSGNTATVSMQYSYLPSWMSFLADGDRSQEAGRLLFESVYAKWLTLPEEQRPQLVVSGESLGSFGGEAAFSGAQDMAQRTSGVLFVGPTANNRLWGQFTAERDKGTKAVAPVYQNGETVRFSADGKNWPGPDSTWHSPKVGYLQHANDPVTWWNWDLAFNKPDWLSEDRGENIAPYMVWLPVVTMLQVGADQAVANSVPVGQGHLFGQAPVYAWAEILPSEGWSQADSDRLAQLIKKRVAELPG
jgi:uncharacterized membrane protein